MKAVYAGYKNTYFLEEREREQEQLDALNNQEFYTES